ncbi:shufflon system plasmid conjugative transfer pilus tip adhesin PilV [Halomonas elongata]|uniref:shufflon system plasmid conjugative transfer pilus tip adhesin PilV n=1 Tax=Halomonas elongata TaxID=2746 RepID=UPI00255B0641|nr:shufflon system plasmid conjugative transfer pilus tip adhesin PilV [Halomonas elongata]MDL4860757.1 shufflon system plasmid conjugative transfer pilus tip adhesin PilV [Halomonas elongata]
MQRAESYYRPRERGITLVEVMIALAVVIAIGVMGFRYVKSSEDRQLATAVSIQHLKVVAAARDYVSDHQTQLVGALDDSVASYLTDLIDDDYLDAGLIRDSGQWVNPYGQGYQVYVRQGADDADPLETLVIASGDPATPTGSLQTVSQKLGAQAAYVDPGSGDLVSAFHDTVPYSPADFGISPSNGSIMYFDSMSHSAQVSDYLYRHSIAGFPELNTMETDIDMSGNNIDNIDTATADEVYAKRFLSSSDGSFFVKPDGTSELKRLNVASNVTAGGDVTADRLVITGVREEGNSCSPNGAVARDSAGKILSCQSGRWQAAATGVPSGMYGYYNSTRCPSGWVKANGTNGTVDLRGEFIRGWDNGRGVDNGRRIGSFQQQQVLRHKHISPYSDNSDYHTSMNKWGTTNSRGYKGSGESDDDNYLGYTNDGTNYDGRVNPAGVIGNENRPRNRALLACMKR